MKKQTDEEIINEFKTFSSDKYSLIVSTTSTKNTPLTNYSPFVQSEGKYYICVSSNLPHFKNMQDLKQAHIKVNAVNHKTNTTIMKNARKLKNYK